MSLDLFICPKKDATLIALEQLRERFISAGLPCTIKPDDGPWIVFDGHNTNLVFTIETDGRASSAVLQAGVEKDLTLVPRIFSVFESFGWSYVEGSF